MLTVEAAEIWRRQRRDIIEEGLGAVDVRLAADLETELDVLRGSAAELLGLDLAVPEPQGRLAESRRFFYAGDVGVGQTDLLAGAVRRALPGELGRRRVRDYLRREAPGLVETQIGRAGATCNTGWPRRPGRWPGRSSNVMATASGGYSPRSRPRPSYAKHPQPRQSRRKENWPTGKRRCVT